MANLNMALPEEIYRKMVLDISHELEGEEPEDIKYLSRKFLPSDELEDIKNFRDLAAKLEGKQVFNLQVLERWLSEIKRYDLVKMVKETKDKHGRPLQTSSCTPGPLSSKSQIHTHGGAFHVDASNLAGKTKGRLESSDLEIDSPVLENDGAGATLGDLKCYCHPPEKDRIVFFSQKEQSKLISRLKTEFCSNPHKKGIIVTKSDQETKSLYCAIESAKELCSAKFIVRPEKILNSFNHQTLIKFNKERCNLLIATDAMVKDKVELCECQFLIRYNVVKKEMGTIQTHARSQESSIKCYLLIYENSEEHEQEKKNRIQVEANA